MIEALAAAIDRIARWYGPRCRYCYRRHQCCPGELYCGALCALLGEFEFPTEIV